MKINAATRIVAMSGEDRARAYVKSVFGKEPGDTKMSHDGLYEFKLPGWKFDAAQAKANSAFDHQPKVLKSRSTGGSTSYKWDMGQSREFVLVQNGYEENNLSVRLLNF